MRRTARGEAFLVDALGADRVADGRQAVRLVVDGVAGGNADRLTLATQQARTQRVERAEPHAADAVPDQLLHASTHLAGRLVGEGDGADLVGAHAPCRDHVRDPVREHAGLAAAGAGKDEQRSIGGLDGLTLGRIQPLQQGRRPDRRAQACAPVAGAGLPVDARYASGRRSACRWLRGVRRLACSTESRSTSAMSNSS